MAYGRLPYFENCMQYRLTSFD